MANSDSREILRFRDFTLDIRGYQLCRAGRPVRIERRPMDLLILLVQRRGELVLHGEIARQLWGEDVFVDVETGIHGAIRKVRQALRDSPDRPLFVETVPARGYRFIAPVEFVASGADAPAIDRPLTAVPDRPVDPDPVPLPEASLSSSAPYAPGGSAGGIRRFAYAPLGAGIVMLFVLVGLLVWREDDGADPESPITLAVMPFENLTGDSGRDYLADGLAEEMVVALDKIDRRRLRVMSRSSIREHLGTRKSAGQIGRELGADYLVESSVRAEGSRLRITAKLIRVRDQVQVWSDSYDREPAGLLAMQRELSLAIASQIRLRLSPDRLDGLSRRQTRHPEAHDLYLRGLNFAKQRTPATTAKAMEYFERATALDPEYALAWSAIALAQTASTMNGDAMPLQVWSRARDAAAQAVRAGPDLPEAHASQASVSWILGWNWPEADAAVRRAVSLDPGFAFAHQMLGHVASQRGQHQEAEAWLRRARELEPLDGMSFAISSQVAFQARDYPAALEYARQAVALDAEFWIGYMMLGQAYERAGQTDLALEALTAAARFSNGNSKPLSLKGYVLAKTGREQDARELLKTLDGAARQRYVPPYAFALIHAGLGDRDAVFGWLERAYLVRDVHLMFLPADPKWDPYRTDPAFVEVLTRCGFTPATLVQ